MEKEQVQQQKHDNREVCEMLQTIAVECHAVEEERICETLLVELSKNDTGQETDLHMNQLNRVAGNLLLNYLEPRLIVAVMEGEDMREKLKLLQPRIHSTKSRLDQQVLQQRQKMERQVVKYVMNFEANYHIMLRKIREDFTLLASAWKQGPPLLMEEEIQNMIAQEEEWCMNQIREDVSELENEIVSFAKELYDIKMKCRQETIQIMDNSFFSMIAQKTERALKMIHHMPIMESVALAKQQMEQQIKEFRLTGISVESELLEQFSESEQDVDKLLSDFSSNVQQFCVRREGKVKRDYNEFLKKFLDQLMYQLRKEATDYLKALENQLTEAVGGRQMRTYVDRDELEHLVEMRNQIAWTFEAIAQKEKACDK